MLMILSAVTPTSERMAPNPIFAYLYRHISLLVQLWCIALIVTRSWYISNKTQSMGFVWNWSAIVNRGLATRENNRALLANILHGKAIRLKSLNDVLYQRHTSNVSIFVALIYATELPMQTTIPVSSHNAELLVGAEEAFSYVLRFQTIQQQIGTVA